MPPSLTQVSLVLPAALAVIAGTKRWKRDEALPLELWVRNSSTEGRREMAGFGHFHHDIPRVSFDPLILTGKSPGLCR